MKNKAVDFLRQRRLDSLEEPDSTEATSPANDIIYDDAIMDSVLSQLRRLVAERFDDDELRIAIWVLDQWGVKLNPSTHLVANQCMTSWHTANKVKNAVAKLFASLYMDRSN